MPQLGVCISVYSTTSFLRDGYIVVQAAGTTSSDVSVVTVVDSDDTIALRSAVFCIEVISLLFDIDKFLAI